MSGDKQKSSQRIGYSFLKILTGSDLSRRRLALMEARSGRPGPVVWLTGCIHGDEVGGIVVIQEMFKRLRRQPLIRGDLYAFPLMNPIGFETISRHIGFSKEDLNRSFPGNMSGSVAERIADKIFTTIVQTRPALVLDLHNDWIKSIPYALIEPCWDQGVKDAYQRSVELARHTGFVLVEDQPAETPDLNLEKTLTGSILRGGMPAITLELGESFIVNEANVEHGVTAVGNILAHLGMIEPPPPAPAIAPDKTTQSPSAPAAPDKNPTGPAAVAATGPAAGVKTSPSGWEIPEAFKDRLLKYTHRPAASTSGIIRFLVGPGQMVKKGDKVAKIYNVFGKLQETIAAEDDGLVLGHSDTSVALPGAPVVAFGLM